MPGLPVMQGVNPFGLWLAGLRTAHMAVEAQTVIAMRLVGYAASLPPNGAGMHRLWAENPGGMIAAGGAAALAALQGRAPEQILEAAMEPLLTKTPAGSGQ